MIEGWDEMPVNLSHTEAWSGEGLFDGSDKLDLLNSG
jgi:hypothetical protein